MANPLRSAMVFLGLADEPEAEYYEEEQQKPAQATAQRPTPAPVTPIRRAQRPAQGELNEILTVHPRAYNDVQVITEHFREGVPVIINISQLQSPDDRRLIDYCSGLSQALYGKFERVTGKVFLLSPAHVVVSGEAADTDEVDASFL